MDEEGTDTLIKLTQLLRLGLRSTREIALSRPKDYSRLMEIADRAEQMALEMDQITGAVTYTAQ